MGVARATELKQSVSGKRMFRSSSSTRQSIEWPLSEVSSDLTVEIGTANFALHKFPLVSRSGKIRKLLAEAKDTKVTRINVHGTPGGAEAFELAAKFCYGINIEITVSNVAMLRCAAHYLQMTEEFSEKNLELQTECYLKEKVLPNIINSISVLHKCENLLPTAEDINIVNRIITMISSNVCREQLTSGLSKLEKSSPLKSLEIETATDWWGKALTILNLDLFQRTLSAMKTKGLKQETISKILIHYAQNSLHGLMFQDIHTMKGSFVDAETMRKQRNIIEAIVSLLPIQSRKSSVPLAFLSGLLKIATVMSVSSLCKADLERRMGLQLDKAIIEDILIPINPQINNANQLYDTDSVERIFSEYLNLDEEDDESIQMREDTDGYEYDSPRSPNQSSIIKISKLLESYLAEIAMDSNLTPSKFTALAERLPDHARVVNDGLYRAVDIFLKVHPNIKESERYRLCKTVDCQKLSPEACSHAAQNDRLPVQMAVQVLYMEQTRLRNAMSGGRDPFFSFAQANGQRSGSSAVSPRDNYASVRRENRELKLEVTRMRMRLTELENDHVYMKQELVRSNPRNRFLMSFADKIRKLNALLFGRGVRGDAAGAGDRRNLLQRHRQRRNSI